MASQLWVFMVVCMVVMVAVISHCFKILIPGELGLIQLQISIVANSALQQQGG